MPQSHQHSWSYGGNVKKDTTQVGMHSVRNLLGEQKQVSLFSDHDREFSSKYGIKLEGSIDQFGIHLSDTASRVMEGILHGFTETDYKGNLEPRSKKDLAVEKYSGAVPDSYRYVQEIPRLRVNQSQILKWAGIKANSIAEKERAVEALSLLGNKQFCFYYDRLACDEEGRGIKGSDGRWKKEEVVSVDTLFLIKEVREEGSNDLKYYEISPSSIFLDQRESYFILMPLGWRDEVRLLVGKRKASSYTFRFLLFLRYQYEKRRRSNEHKTPYTLRWTAEEIAIAIKMPESVYKRRKKRMNEILDDAYFVARELGYLTSYERASTVDVLTFRDDKYYIPGGKGFIQDQKESKLVCSEQSIELFEAFHQAIKNIDSNHELPLGSVKDSELKVFDQLLAKRSKIDIERAFAWALSNRFWCSKILTPKKLQSNFQALWIEMQAGASGVGDIAEKHKQLARKLEKLAYSEDGAIRVVAYSDCLCINLGRGGHDPVFAYKDRSFISNVKAAFDKYHVKLKTKAQLKNKKAS